MDGKTITNFGIIPKYTSTKILQSSDVTLIQPQE